MKAYKKVTTKEQPVSEPAMGRTDMKLNEAGGYVFEAGVWERVRRFLVLGSEGGTYYISEKDLTKQNVDNLLAAIQEDGKRFVDEVVTVSVGNLAPKTDPAILALALAAKMGDVETRRYAWGHLNQVCRTGTHLLHFLVFCQNLGSWNRMSRRGVEGWFMGKSPDALARQVTKYQSRDGMSMRDALRLAHVKIVEPQRSAVLRWVVANDLGERQIARHNQGDKPVSYPKIEVEAMPDIILGFEAVKRATTEAEVVRLIEQYKLEREHVPTQWLNSAKVWAALLPNLGDTAILRNLGKLTAVGLLTPMSDWTTYVVNRLSDVPHLTASRVHPMAMLIANRVYYSGHGVLGSLTWQPVRQLVDVTDEGFYRLFGSVKPIDKRVQFAIDCSGSMSSPVTACHALSCRDAGVALALVAANTEKQYVVTGFTCGGDIRELAISPKQRLSDAIDYVNRTVRAGGTDCSLPVRWAKDHSYPFDAIAIYTDSETWSGPHPFQMLQDYRKHVNLPTRLIVASMAANDITIADSKDPLSLNVVGFDASVPDVMSSFARGEL